MSIGRLTVAFAAIALLFGLALVYATPPFHAPDEAGHFWRADAIALGYWLAPMHHGHPSALVPRGIEQLWYGRHTPLELDHRALVHFPAYYTPLPHLPQALACFIGHRLDLAFVKAVYFPIALMTRRVSAYVACAISLIVTLLLLRQMFYVDRPGAFVDPAAQLRGIAHAPFTFIAIVAGDYARHAPRYAEELVGRLGLLDVALPRIVIAMLLVLVVAVALTNDVRFTAKERVLAAVSIATSMLLISTSQYLNWTPPHAHFIDGVQGRYFLPLLPLAMRRRIPVDVIFAVLIVANLMAVIAITPTP